MDDAPDEHRCRRPLVGYHRSVHVPSGRRDGCGTPLVRARAAGRSHRPVDTRSQIAPGPVGAGVSDGVPWTGTVRRPRTDTASSGDLTEELRLIEVHVVG